jgi:hypothetical protein
VIFKLPRSIGRNHLIVASYKKAYGTRGYEAKTLIIVIKREEIHPGRTIASLVWLIDLFWFDVCHPEGICKQKHKRTNKITKNKTLDKRDPPPLGELCSFGG